MLGINDGLTNVTAEDYGDALGLIIDHVFENGIAREVHLVRPSRLAGVPGKDSLFAAYGAELHALALRPNVSAGVDLWTALDPRPSLSRWPHGEEADLVENALDGVEVPGLGSAGRGLVVLAIALSFPRPRSG